MKSWITHYDEELLAAARVFLAAAEAHPESREILDRYGFSDAERARGRLLIDNTTRSFEWDRSGRAWNFLSPTPERRRQEALHWYADTRRRWLRQCFRDAEEASGWAGDGPQGRWSLRRKLTLGTWLGLRRLGRALSLSVYREHRAERARNLARAGGEKPDGAPPPKDTTLVELAGWYEHWRLLAQRVFRDRADLMAPYGLKPGKAPPRLRGKLAQIRYGERAAGSLHDSVRDDAEAEDESGDEAQALH